MLILLVRGVGGLSNNFDAGLGYKGTLYATGTGGLTAYCAGMAVCGDASGPAFSD